MPAIHLTDRAILRASGEQASSFLHGVITCHVKNIEVGQAHYGALLTPQGKIISDFLIARDGEESYFIDAPAEAAADLLKRLTFLRLRAKVVFELLPDMAAGVLVEEDAEVPDGAFAYADPRHEGLGRRLVMPRAGAETLSGDDAAYEALRISLGIPRSGVDFGFNDAFPHEADMDQLEGVDFKKGCYVGQEVVSRMEHRTNARNRLVQVLFPQAAVAGVEIFAGDKPAGRVTSASGREAIAMVRLDRANEARQSGVPLLADGVEVELQKPEWADFDMAWARKESPLQKKVKAKAQSGAQGSAHEGGKDGA